MAPNRQLVFFRSIDQVQQSGWSMVKRLDSTFDLKDYGYTSFSEMLKAMDAVVEVKKGEKDGQLRLR